MSMITACDINSVFDEMLYGKNSRALYWSKRDDGSYVSAFELPGCSKESTNIECDDGYLSVKSTRSYDKKKFSMTISLPKNVDDSTLNAKLSDGLLVVTVGGSKLKKKIEIE